MAGSARRKNFSLRSGLYELGDKSRRDNIFCALSDTADGTWTEEKFLNFLTLLLNLSITRTDLERARKLGFFLVHICRPIIARFAPLKTKKLRLFTKP